jgi:putative dimethyl sulfoxide reductase chaperone
MSGYDGSDKASARADLCLFLAACYYEPDPEFAEERLFDSMLKVAVRIDPDLADLARKLGDDFAAQDLQNLLVDYTKLFLGSPQPLVSPHASVWLSGAATSMQDSTMVALDLYDQAGFELDEEIRDVPDHVAVELEFLSLLTSRQSEAYRADLADIVRDWEQLERFFLQKHMGIWIGPFAAAVRAGAETAFYRSLAELTERFVRMEEAGTKERR